MNIKKIIPVLILTLLIMSANARKLYVDFNGGADASAGTSTGAAWKHHPYMVGWTGSYTHAAGDTFIFKGSVTWPASCFSLTIAGDGTSSHRDYYGVDKTWYTGATFTHPKFDNGGTSFTKFIAGTANYISIDNIEFTGYYWDSLSYVYWNSRAG